MPLTLRALSLNGQLLTQPITAVFDAEGGTIGRADHNRMALPDPGRHISRQQVQVSVDAAGVFRIRNIGSANAVVVRGQPLARGESAALGPRDPLRIGAYLLEVSADKGAAGMTITHGRAPLEWAADAARRVAAIARSTRRGASGGLADLEAPLAPNNPFVDLLRDAPTAAGVAPSSPAWGVPPSPPVARLPDDFDPMAPPAPRPGSASGAIADDGRPRRAGEFDDLIPRGEAESIDDLIAARRGNDPGPPAAFMADVQLPRAPSADQPALVPPASLPASPRARMPTPHSPVARDPPRASDPQTMSAWAAFCAGAGIRADPQQSLDAQQMQRIGQLLRAAVEGSLQLMAVRATARHELHAQVTVIQPRGNNALKFAPDGQSALEQLLEPPLPGFLDAPAAMTDAMQDVVGHAIGTMAGTRAALEGLLERFAPAALEARLEARALDSLLPGHRKARLWELYLQHFESIRGEAHDDFHALFGRAFLAAYEQQIERAPRAAET